MRFKSGSLHRYLRHTACSLQRGGTSSQNAAWLVPLSFLPTPGQRRGPKGAGGSVSTGTAAPGLPRPRQDWPPWGKHREAQTPEGSRSQQHVEGPQRTTLAAPSARLLPTSRRGGTQSATETTASAPFSHGTRPEAQGRGSRLPRMSLNFLS